MKKKYLNGNINLSRKISVYLLTFILTLSGMIGKTIPTIVQAAAVDTRQAVPIKSGTTGGDNWAKNSKHKYSSFADSKNKALLVDARYGFRIQKTTDTKITEQILILNQQQRNTNGLKQQTILLIIFKLRLAMLDCFSAMQMDQMENGLP